MYDYLKTFHKTIISFNNSRNLYAGENIKDFISFKICEDDKIALLKDNQYIHYDETDKAFFISPNQFFFNLEYCQNSLSIIFNNSYLSASNNGSISFKPWRKEWEYFNPVSLIANKIKYKYLELHAVDHCNLNCKGCTHFCPLIKEEYFHDPEVVYNDLHQISKYIDFQMIRILGGEPLLHPRINSILNFVRRAYWDAPRIALVTNGILLPKMDQAFWQTLRVNDIFLNVSYYPAVKNINKIKDIVNEQHVSVVFTPEITNFHKTLYLKPTATPLEEKYTKCTHKNCKTLYKGRLYQCPTAIYINYFNKYYSEHVPVSPGLNIYTMSRDQIIDFFANPFETCNHCDYTKGKLFPWAVSTKQKEDWICDA